MKISSPEFKNNQMMPKKITCQGEDINPSLIFEDIPKDAKSLALIMDDPDAPNETFVHWVMYNMPIIEKLDEDSQKGLEGKNSSGSIGYFGPCPPTGSHHYFFKLYALDITLDLQKGATKLDLEKAIEGHIIKKAELIGLYEKS
ncbi:MAG: putative lipoprotein LppC [Candidatus Anoxychlamydiales bacterium]|nr:putative lipoprotein LppC [Candidatus Anoxychlamydiales bacterium]